MFYCYIPSRMALAGRGASLLRSLARNTVANGFRFQSTGRTSTRSKVIPLIAGSLTAVCVATGATYYSSKVVDSGVTCSLLDSVHASAAKPPTMSAKHERTFIMIKPDGVHRGLIADILSRFERRGYKLVAMKMMQASESLLKQHYGDLSSKPFFPGLVKFMGSGPVVAMVWEGKDVVCQGRLMLGETNPLSSRPGTIRGDYCIDIGRNIVHGSDSVETARKEIGLWFEDKELVNWDMNAKDWVYE